MSKKQQESDLLAYYDAREKQLRKDILESIKGKLNDNEVVELQETENEHVGICLSEDGSGYKMRPISAVKKEGDKVFLYLTEEGGWDDAYWYEVCTLYDILSCLIAVE